MGVILQDVQTNSRAAAEGRPKERSAGGRVGAVGGGGWIREVVALDPLPQRGFGVSPPLEKSFKVDIANASSCIISGLNSASFHL